MNNKKFFWGIVFILIGLLGLANQIININLFEFGNLWPLFILIPGLSFEYSYFVNKKNSGLLVPGGILTIIGLLFVFETATRWNFSRYTWPIYILAPAIGLFQLYIFGERDRGLLIPVGVLTIIAVISFISISFGNIFVWLNTSIILPIGLVAIGLYIIFSKEKKI